MNELTSEVAEVTCNEAKECDGPEFEEDAAALLPGPSGSVDASECSLVFIFSPFLTSSRSRTAATSRVMCEGTAINCFFPKPASFLLAETCMRTIRFWARARAS